MKAMKGITNCHTVCLFYSYSLRHSVELLWRQAQGNYCLWGSGALGQLSYLFCWPRTVHPQTSTALGWSSNLTSLQLQVPPFTCVLTSSSSAQLLKTRSCHPRALKPPVQSEASVTPLVPLRGRFTQGSMPIRASLCRSCPQTASYQEGC